MMGVTKSWFRHTKRGYNTKDYGPNGWFTVGLFDGSTVYGESHFTFHFGVNRTVASHREIM
jgi:hypothetical protein